MTHPGEQPGDRELLEQIRHHVDVGTVHLPEPEQMTRTDVMAFGAYMQLRGQTELIDSMQTGHVPSSIDQLQSYRDRVDRVARQLWTNQFDQGGSGDA